MPKYRGYGRIAGTIYFDEVEAKDAEEARDLFEVSEQNHVCLCHQCANEIELNEWSAQEIEVEEVEEE